MFSASTFPMRACNAIRVPVLRPIPPQALSMIQSTRSFSSNTTPTSTSSSFTPRPYLKSASQSSAATSQPLSGPGASVRSRRAAQSSRLSESAEMPSLKQFMLRSQVLQLYRRMLRSAKRIEDASMRRECIQHASQEFKAMKKANETSHIKALLQEGRRKLEQFETMLNLTK